MSHDGIEFEPLDPEIEKELSASRRVKRKYEPEENIPDGVVVENVGAAGKCLTRIF